MVLFGLICIAPVAPFTLFGFVDAASRGAVVLPYVIGAIGLGLTALSYAEMVGVAPQAGSVHGFATLAMGKHVGFLGGWAITLDYVVIGALEMLYGALYLHSVVTGLSVEAIVAVFAIGILAINLLGVHWSARLDMVLTGLQIAIGVVFAVAALMVLTGAGNGDTTFAPLWPAGVSLADIAAATPIAVIAFLGFDAVSTLSEEVRSPRPGAIVGRATLLTLGLMLVLFVSLSWLLVSLSSGVAIADPSTATLDILAARIPWLTVPLSLIVAVAFWGGTTATHAGVARLGFAMARAGQLPRFLAYVHPGRQVPTGAVLLYGMAITLIAYLALPNVDLLTGLVTFGAIVGFILVNLSVIVHFGLRGRSRRWVLHWLAPALGLVVLLWVLSGIRPQAMEFGLIWLAIGIAWYFGRHMLPGSRRPRSST